VVQVLRGEDRRRVDDLVQEFLAAHRVREPKESDMADDEFEFNITWDGR
jgi:hypothetical protein